VRLLLIGCEYAGKQTLAAGISRWMIRAMGVPYARWHDHYVVPHLDGHTIVRGDDETAAPGKEEADLNTAADEEQILSLHPGVLEQLQRHMIWRHLHPDMYRDDDVLSINHYYADAVYAPIYHGYGEPSSFADRVQRARAWDVELLELTPDTVLVLVEADAETIRRRMAESPPRKGPLHQEDVPRVLKRFREEFDESLLHIKITLDTTTSSSDETLERFLKEVEPHLATVDRLRILSGPGNP
jgi:thymidylate kinase